MALLQLIAKIRCPFLDALMLAITTLGDETAFLVIALFIFWCVDKRKGYFILSVGFVGTVLNQFLKLLCRVPRPWNVDVATSHEWKIKADLQQQAYMDKWDSLNPSGYSFPSGHSQNAVATYGGTAYVFKNKILKGLCIALCVLIPFSRMYFGVHTLQDVLVGAGMAAVLIFALKPVVLGNDGKYFPWFLLVMTVLAVGFLCFAQFYPNSEILDADAYYSARKNAYTLTGALAGFLVAYPIEKKYVRYSERAIWWAQLLKMVLGLGIVLLAKEGLKIPLASLLGELPGRMVRYFVTVLVAAILWPLTFKWFSAMGKKE